MLLTVDAITIGDRDLLWIADSRLRGCSFHVEDEPSGDFWYAFASAGTDGSENVCRELIAHLRDNSACNIASGASICGVALTSGKATLVNAGSCRLYRWRDGMLQTLTGSDDGSAICEDDVLVLCTEGIHAYVPEEELEYFLTVSSVPAEDICDRAEVNGLTGSAAVALIRIGGGSFGDGDAPDDDGRWDPFV